jgi:hypothetical protein
MPNRPTLDGDSAAAQRSPEYAHLSLQELRDYRRTLLDEETRVSYWRRIIQARLDMVVAGPRSAPTVEALREVLSSDRFGTRRQAIVGFVPSQDIPPIPDLATLWDRQPVEGDDAHNRALVDELNAAEAELSAYRTALHDRLAAATGELIARYREDPTLCLSALPSPQSRVPRPSVRATRRAAGS